MKVVKKPLGAVSGIVVFVVLVTGWHYLLVSSRSPELKAWESCKAKILESWAGSHADQVKPLLRFTEDHFYSFGGEGPADHFDDHDSRGTAVTEARQFGINEHELIELDQRIAKECGPFPRESVYQQISSFFYMRQNRKS